MAAQLGGAVEPGTVREFGYAEVRAHGHSALLKGIAGSRNAGRAWAARRLDEPRRQGHRAAAGVQARSGSSKACAIAAMADEARQFYAVQFHPEVTHTKQGAAILARFAHDICGCGHDWNMADYAGEAVAAIRAQVGAEEVILGLSGGVDSSVAAALIHKAIGDAAHLRLRRPRAAAAERGRAGDGHLRAEPRRARDPRRRDRRDVRGARRRRRPGAEAPDHRPALRRRLPARGGASCRTSSGWRRGRSTPT